MMFEEMSSSAFAKLCGVHKKTLFYYDEINLLKPARRAANGYRYYTVKEFVQMDSIKQLQLLGFSLEEIQAYLSAASLQERESYLQRQKQAIARKRQELQRIEESLLWTEQQMERFARYGTDTVFEERLATQYYQLQSIQRPFLLSFLFYGDRFGMILPAESQTLQDTYYTVFYRGEPQAAEYIREAGAYCSMYIYHTQDVRRQVEAFVQKLPAKPEGDIYYEGVPNALHWGNTQKELVKLSARVR